MENKKKTVVVIGGGAAGFFTAIQIKELSRQPIDVIILEKTSKLLSKVKISGGGRCNVTNSCQNIHEFAKQYPRGEQFLKKAFHTFNNQHIIDWFAQKDVKIVAEPDGRMFPKSNSSQTIIDTFLNAVVQHNIVVHTQTVVQSIAHKNNAYIVNTSTQTIYADCVVIAIGGYPKYDMYQWLHSQPIHQHIVAPVPSLFSFNLVLTGLKALQGLSVPHAQIKILGTKLTSQGPLLITHWGLSGPAILKLSAWGARALEACNYQFQILINWLPEYNEESMNLFLMDAQKKYATRHISNKNPLGFPARLWELFMNLSDIEEGTLWSHLKAKNRHLLSKNLCNMLLDVSGKTTYKEEFVTAGGIDTTYIDVQTMEHKLMPHLYVVGEALNIDGITGGFNFQNAWTTSYIAAKHIANTV